MAGLEYKFVDVTDENVGKVGLFRQKSKYEEKCFLMIGLYHLVRSHRHRNLLVRGRPRMVNATVLTSGTPCPKA